MMSKNPFKVIAFRNEHWPYAVLFRYVITTNGKQKFLYGCTTDEIPPCLEWDGSVDFVRFTLCKHLNN